jgi:hypothetical protein
MADKVYQQTDGYMPATDAGFRDWLLNFSTLIAADPRWCRWAGARRGW